VSRAQPIAWSDPRLATAWLVLGAVTVAGVVTWPHTFINADEYLYVGQARLLAGGSLHWHDGAALPGGLPDEPEGVRYPFGWPVLLVAMLWGGLRALYVVPFALHLLAGASFARILARRGAAPELAVLFLAHPVFWSFSRTLMSDAPSAALLVIAIDHWEQGGRARWVTGMALGWSVFMRLGGLFSVAGFLLAVALEVLEPLRGAPSHERRSRAWLQTVRDQVPLASGLLVGAVCLATFNWLASGSPLRTGYTHVTEGTHFATEGLGERVALYLAGLLLIPPFSGALALARPKRCDRWILGAIPVLLFFFAYSYHDRSARWYETLLGGQRLVLAAHVFAMVGTARVWGAITFPGRRLLAVAVAVVFPAVHAVAIGHLVGRYRPTVDLIRACAPQSVAYNRAAARVALANDAARYHILDESPIATSADVAVVALASPTNQPLVRPPEYVLPESLRARIDTCERVGEFFVFDLRGVCPPDRPRVPCDPADFTPSGP
jgi:hypothetical protein